MDPKPSNVAVIGYGMSAKVFHIPLIESIPDFKLYAIVQRHPKPADDATQDRPGVKSYRSTLEVVKDEEVGVVVVTTVPDTHVELTKLALENGKHGMFSPSPKLSCHRKCCSQCHQYGRSLTRIALVIVEKPFAPTSREADELVDLAKKKQCLLTVYQSMPLSSYIPRSSFFEAGACWRSIL